MEDHEEAKERSLEQLGHHIGLHVTVNLQGKTVGGVLFEAEEWVPGVIVGMSALGNALTIELETPIGGGEREGLLHRRGRGQDLVSIDDPSRIRALELDEVAPEGIPEEIVELARAGKTLEAIKRYRALNGASLDEARAAIAKLSG